MERTDKLKDLHKSLANYMKYVELTLELAEEALKTNQGLAANLLEELELTLPRLRGKITRETCQKLKNCILRLTSQLSGSQEQREKRLSEILESIPDETPEPTTGQMPALFVLEDKNIGFVNDFQIKLLPKPDVSPDLDRRMTDGMKKSIWNALARAKRILESKYPLLMAWTINSYRLSFTDDSDSPNIETYDKDSIGLPACLCFISANIGRPIPAEFSATGTVDEQGNVCKVGGINEKLEAIFREREYVRTVLVPEKNEDAVRLDYKTRIKPIAKIKEAINSVFGDIKVKKPPLLIQCRTLEQLFNVAREKGREYALDAEQAFLDVLDIADDPLNNEHQNIRVKCLHRLGNWCLHYGRLLDVEKRFGEADEIIERLINAGTYSAFGKMDAEEYRRFRNSKCTFLKDVYDFEQAERILNELIEERKQAGDKDALYSMGSLGELYLLWRKLDLAEKMMSEVLDLCEAGDKPQHLNHLGSVYTDKGDYNQAERCFQDSLKICAKCLKEQYPKSAERSELYSRCGLTKLYYRWGKLDRVIENADLGEPLCSDENEWKFLYPKGPLLKWKACALWELGRKEEAVATFRESYEYLEGLGSDGNLQAIASTSRLELALRLLSEGKEERAEGIKSEIETAISNFKLLVRFPSAERYFKTEISALEAVSKDFDEADETRLNNAISPILAKIPY